MEFTVFTSAGGFREFLGQSTYEIGKQNGCLYVVDGSGQSVTYGANAWASVQDWQRDGLIVPPAGESPRELPQEDVLGELDELGMPTEAVMEALEVAVAEVPDVPQDLGPLEIPQDPEPMEVLQPSAHAAAPKPRRSRAAAVSYEEAEPVIPKVAEVEKIAPEAPEIVVEPVVELDLEAAAEASPPRQFDPLMDPLDTFAEPPSR